MYRPSKFLNDSNYSRSLRDLFKLCGRQFDLISVVMLADELIDQVEYLHSRGCIHGDIKPECFILQMRRNYRISMIPSESRTKKFICPNTQKHIRYREYKGLKYKAFNLGFKARYASINTHLGVEQSRRDDLESLGYVLIYLLRGRLPWDGLGGRIQGWPSDVESNRIFLKKRSTPIEVLCESSPSEFILYFNHVRSLKFEEMPNYNYLKRLFRDVLSRESYGYDYVFDFRSLEASFKTKPPSPSVNRQSMEAFLRKLDLEAGYDASFLRKQTRTIYRYEQPTSDAVPPSRTKTTTRRLNVKEEPRLWMKLKSICICK